MSRADLQAMVVGEKKFLGEGAYGSCVKGRDASTGQEVVVKTFPKRSLQEMVTEATTLWALHRVPGVQRLLGACVQTR